MVNRRSFLAATSGLLLPSRLMGQSSGGSMDWRTNGAQRPGQRIVYGDKVVGSSSAVVDGPIHEGVEITVDLPREQHVKNFGAPKDNLGLCVFASMTMGARWHNVRPLTDIIHKLDEGGGWPEKVSHVFKQFAPKLDFIQYEGTDPAMMHKGIAEGRMLHVTYGYGERYKMQTIAHMVCLVHIDAEWAVVLDNNFPGTYEWMPRAEFLKRWVHPNGQGWSYVMMAPPPPPVPRN